MTEGDVWFTYFKGGGRQNLQPRGGRGWLALFALIGTFALGAAVTIGLGFAGLPAAPIGILVPMAGLFAFYRVARRHTRVIDLNKVDREWDQFEAWRARERDRLGR